MRNRTLAAFKENYNLLGLASAAIVALACRHPAPLVLGLAGELLYLAFVPHSKWYAHHLAKREAGSVTNQRDQKKASVLPGLHPRLQERFAKLEAARGEIERQAGPDSLWIREIIRQLDFLLEKFLDFAQSEEQFRNYLKEARAEVEGQQASEAPPRLSPDGAWSRDTVALIERSYDMQISALELQLQVEIDDSSRPLVIKRIEILERRREFIGKIGKTIANLIHQLALLEDTFGVIRDELLARSPEQVLSDIEDVVSQTQIMSEVLEGMGPYERILESMEPSPQPA